MRFSRMCSTRWPSATGRIMVEARPANKTYSEALEIVLSHAPPLGSEQVALRELGGRALSEPVRAPFDIPLFDNSAVDGYAIGAEVVEELISKGNVRLDVAGSIAAGDPESHVLGPGQSYRIFTGARVPAGCFAVIMQEDADCQDGQVALGGNASEGMNIRRRGDECRLGDALIEPGCLLGPGAVALIAECGLERASVYRLPTVGILATGSELTQPGEELKAGAIYESNSFGLRTAFQEAGIVDLRMEHVQDDLEGTQRSLDELLNQCDIVVTAGGVSVGDHDLVRGCLSILQVEEQVWGVRLKPGKPFYFGTPRSERRCHAVFGLPGNPLSALVTAQLFVWPYLRKTLGMSRPTGSTVTARLSKSIRKHTDRLEFVPGMLRWGADGPDFEPTLKRGSHMLSGFSCSNALGMFPLESMEMEAGSNIETMMIRWGLKIDV